MLFFRLFQVIVVVHHLYGNKTRDLVLLRHNGEDSGCQDDLLICTCTRLRSVYCCHHLKQNSVNVMLSIGND